MLVPTRQLPNQERPGVVLIAVLVVVVVLSLAAYQYSEYMQAEYQAAHSHAKMGQTKALAMSGVNFVAVMLSSTQNQQNNLNGGNFYNNPDLWSGVLVQDDENPKLRGRFTIVGLVSPDDQNFQNTPSLFGVVDEASKLNLNALLELDSTGNIGFEILMTLPNMTEDVANSILDWLDANTTTPRTDGAKDEYYMQLTPPYHCKNGPLDSIDELLLVKGVTPALLYGNDLNKNGQLDPNEDDGSGQVDRGWAAYLTIYSREPNADANGNARIYLNDQDLNNLYTKLQTAFGVELANFIIAYRLYGPAAPAPTITATVSGKGGVLVNGMAATPGSTAKQQYAPLTGQDASDLTSTIQTALAAAAAGTSRGAPKPISSVYALINSSVSATVGTGNTQRAVTVTSPLNAANQQTALLPLLLDQCTTSQATDLPARINVLTASETVLSSLPMLAEADVQAILSVRPDFANSTAAPDPIFSTPAWLITEANLAPTTVQAAERYITSRSGIYSFQSIGYFDGGGPTTRLEAVIDTNYGRPRIIHLQDLSELGKAYSVPFNGSSPSMSTTP